MVEKITVLRISTDSWQKLWWPEGIHGRKPNPGEKMYIDWVGDQPELLPDTETRDQKVHIFATTLPVSSLIYAEAFPNEKLPCFIEGCAHAVSFYGAVTKYFVPDNLRTVKFKHT